MAKRDQKTYRLSPLTGGINSVAEDGSLHSYYSPNNPVGIELRDMENFMPLRRGGLSKTKGFSIYQDLTNSGVITGLYRFKRSAGTNELLATHGIGLYRVTPNSHTLISSGLANNHYTHFETAYDECIVCDGVSVPKRYNGTAVTDVTGSPLQRCPANAFLSKPALGI